MLNRMAHINLSRRAAHLLVVGSSKNLVQLCSTRPVMTECPLGGWDSHLVLTSSSTTQPDSSGSTEESSYTERRPLDRRVQMHRMRNNITGPGPGLRLAKNRNDLVAEFYDLTKSVMDGQISVESLMDSETFALLYEQMNYHIDIMSNTQVVNILASLVKMGVDPSTDMVKLLEHEIKFRINSLSMKQVIKLLKFYGATETPYEQKQLADILNNRIRSTLNSPKATVQDLVDIYHHFASCSTQRALLGLNEEKLLNLLVSVEAEDEDIVSNLIPESFPYDYVSLCHLFIELAAAKRRPTPLLKAASSVLAKLPLHYTPNRKPDVLLLIETLNSLVNLSYTSRPVVSRLIADLTGIIDLNQIDLATQCNLLRSIASLKWRSDALMKQFYEYVTNHGQNRDPRLIRTLLHVTVRLNYKPHLEVHEFYEKFIKGSVEDSIDRNSRKWLDHVWSLTILRVASDWHFDSVLNDEFIAAIENPENVQRIQHADAMKILNLRAIANLENHLELATSENLDKLAGYTIQRGSDIKKYASKIGVALRGIAKSTEDLIHDVETPFGFVIDCVVSMSSDSNLTRLDKDAVLNDLTKLPREPVVEVDEQASAHKLALVYVLFDEVLSNYPNEPVSHKRIISRILDSLGYKTVFLPESVLNREKTSAGLATHIKELMTSAIN